MNRIHLFLSSIKGQLILGVMLLHAILMGVFVYDFLIRERHFLYEQLLSQEKGLGALVASNAALPLMNNDWIALNELMNQVESLPDVQMIFIVDNHLHIRASNQETYALQKFADPQSITLQNKLFHSSATTVQTSHDHLLDTASRIQLGG